MPDNKLPEFHPVMDRDSGSNMICNHGRCEIMFYNGQLKTEIYSHASVALSSRSPTGVLGCPLLDGLQVLLDFQRSDTRFYNYGTEQSLVRFESGFDKPYALLLR